VFAGFRRARNRFAGKGHAVVQPNSAGSLWDAPEGRVKKGAGMIVLLVLVSLANAFVLVLSVGAVADAAEHGDEDLLPLLLLSTGLTVVAVVGLVGAWLTRKWGPRLYVGVAGVSLVLGLVIAEGAISPFSLVGVALAVGLWLTAEANW
jgi:hypothetical protein